MAAAIGAVMVVAMVADMVEALAVAMVAAITGGEDEGALLKWNCAKQCKSVSPF